MRMLYMKPELDDLSQGSRIAFARQFRFKKFINEWEQMREKRKRREISYEEYMEWKLTYEVNAHE